MHLTTCYKKKRDLQKLPNSEEVQQQIRELDAQIDALKRQEQVAAATEEATEEAKREHTKVRNKIRKQLERKRKAGGSVEELCKLQSKIKHHNDNKEAFIAAYVAHKLSRFFGLFNTTTDANANAHPTTPPRGAATTTMASPGQPSPVHTPPMNQFAQLALSGTTPPQQQQQVHPLTLTPPRLFGAEVYGQATPEQALALAQEENRWAENQVLNTSMAGMQIGMQHFGMGIAHIIQRQGGNANPNPPVDDRQALQGGPPMPLQDSTQQANRMTMRRVAQTPPRRQPVSEFPSDGWYVPTGDDGVAKLKDDLGLVTETAFNWMRQGDFDGGAKLLLRFISFAVVLHPQTFDMAFQSATPSPQYLPGLIHSIGWIREPTASAVKSFVLEKYLFQFKKNSRVMYRKLDDRRLVGLFPATIDDVGTGIDDAGTYTITWVDDNNVQKTVDTEIQRIELRGTITKDTFRSNVGAAAARAW